jgi:ribosomal protein L32E
MPAGALSIAVINVPDLTLVRDTAETAQVSRVCGASLRKEPFEGILFG